MRCCSTSYAVFELAAATVGNPTSPPASSSTSTSSSISKFASSSSTSVSAAGTSAEATTGVSRPAPTNTSTVSPIPDSSSDNSLKIGLGIGIAGGILLLVGAAYFIYHKRKSDRILRTMQAQLDAVAGPSRPFGIGTKVELHGESIIRSCDWHITANLGDLRVSR
jgi:hypothetical protein